MNILIKKLNTVFVLVITVFFSLSLNVFAENESGLSGRAKIQLILPYSESFPKASNEDKQKLANLGWIETSEGFVRYYPLINAEISLSDNVVALTDNQGYFTIKNIKNGTHTLKVNNSEIMTDRTINFKGTSTKDNYIDLTTTVNFLTFMQDPETQNVTNSAYDHYEITTTHLQPNGNEEVPIIPASDPGNPYNGGYYGENAYSHDGHTDATYSRNSYVTCNRFNGHHGNQVYYNKSAHPVDSAVNFTISDCDVAIGNGAICLSPSKGDYADDPNNRYCKSFALDVYSSGTCSQVISHRPLYHAHTEFNYPTGY